VRRTFTIKNKLGLHARAAAQLVQLAANYASDLTIAREDQEVNGKSIMGLMMLAAGPGSKLTIHTEGNDASQAMAELETLIKRKFDED